MTAAWVAVPRNGRLTLDRSENGPQADAHAPSNER
jgi:hypothetical protein